MLLGFRAKFCLTQIGLRFLVKLANLHVVFPWGAGGIPHEILGSIFHSSRSFPPGNNPFSVRFHHPLPIASFWIVPDYPSAEKMACQNTCFSPFSRAYNFQGFPRYGTYNQRIALYLTFPKPPSLSKSAVGFQRSKSSKIPIFTHLKPRAGKNFHFNFFTAFWNGRQFSLG